MPGTWRLARSPTTDDAPQTKSCLDRTRDHSAGDPPRGTRGHRRE